jgi:F-type H+-transporting ATPase subunit b
MPSLVEDTIDLRPMPTAEVESAIFSPDVSMIMLTWGTFFFLLFILQKFAWRPILKSLNDREESIRKALDDADRVKREMEEINKTRLRLMTEAQEKAVDIIGQSRKAALEAARVIEDRAKEGAQISVENALREIQQETRKAQIQLREEGARIAVGLAGKLVEANLDTEKNRALINQVMEEIA